MEITKVEKMLGLNVPSNALRCVIDGKECFVPQDEKNMDYLEVKKLEKEGKVVVEEVDVVKNPRELLPMTRFNQHEQVNSEAQKCAS